VRRDIGTVDAGDFGDQSAESWKMTAVERRVNGIRAILARQLHLRRPLRQTARSTSDAIKVMVASRPTSPRTATHETVYITVRFQTTNASLRISSGHDKHNPAPPWRFSDLSRGSMLKNYLKNFRPEPPP